jgi:hypothetical protein
MAVVSSCREMFGQVTFFSGLLALSENRRTILIVI